MQNGRMRAIVVHQLRDIHLIVFVCNWIAFVNRFIEQILHERNVEAKFLCVGRSCDGIELFRVTGQDNAAINLAISRA